VRLAGATALVTGATGGLGQAIARALAGQGASLVLSGRRTEVLEPLAGELGARTLACDLADPAAVERLAAEAADVDVLIANAGLPGSGHISTFTVEDIDRALTVNLRAPMVLARLLSEPMAARGNGHIVFMSSLSGKVGSGGAAVYSATKFGLRGYAHALREDLRPSGVGVSVVLPGFVRDAGMLHEADVQLPRWVGLVRPEQVAAAVVRAIEQDRAELDVAPLTLRAGAWLAGLAPELSATLARRLGGRQVAETIAEGQRGKRA
jgi:short-subunit dehydrogenase